MTDHFSNTLLIAGSRQFTENERAHRAVDKAVEYAIKAWGLSGSSAFLWHLSGTQKGADRLGEAWAKRNEIPTLQFPPSPMHGPRERFLHRNEAMAMMGPYALLLFWWTEGIEDVSELLTDRRNNRGTQDMLRRLRKYKHRSWGLGGEFKPVLVAYDEVNGRLRGISGRIG